MAKSRIRVSSRTVFSSVVSWSLCFFILVLIFSCHASRENKISACLKDISSKDIEKRETALEDLINMGDDAVPNLIGLIQRGDRLTQKEASWALGIIGNKKAVMPLLDNMHSKDLLVVRYSALALGMIGGDDAVQGLIALLKDEKEVNIWNHVIMALGTIGDARAETELKKLLNSESVFIRFSVRRALQRISQRKE